MNTQKSVSGIRVHASQPNSGKRRSMRLLLAGLTSALVIAFVVWATVPAVSTSKSLSAATKSKSKEKSTAKDKEKSEEVDPDSAEKTLKLNYFSASWPRVFQDIAESGDMEFVGDKLPRGRFSRQDKREYTRPEAIRIVNKEIEPQGMKLIEKGQFLILIDIPIANYPPAVLPRKSAPKRLDEDQDVSSRAEPISKPPRNGRIDSAVYREPGDERSTSTGKGKSPRSIRQASVDESESETQTSRRAYSIESSVPPELEDTGAAVPFSTYRARKLTAVDLSKRVYRALKSEAELVDSGRNGLPAFRVVSPEFRSKEAKPTRGGHAQTVEFMISIDENRNELLIDGSAKSIDAVMKLLRIIDRDEAEQTRTQIKPSSKYVCQVADQLPAEIDRIRAATNSKSIAKVPVNGKPLGLADETQRRVPAAKGNDEQRKEETPDPTDRPLTGALGNFKGEVNIEVIEDLNVMIIRGNERDVDQIMDVIKQIEKLSEATSPEVHLIHLRNVDSESLAELLTSVYEKLTKFPGKATQPRESVAIIPVSKPNSLLIVAPQTDVESILDLADQLDKPVDPQTEFEVFALKSAVAADVETLITDFYKERKALGAKVLVIADARSNAVIVRARPRDLDEIKELISKMDRDEVGSVNQVKVFVLKNAVATELAAVITTAIQSVLSPPKASTGGAGGAGGQGGGAGLGGGQVEEQFKSVRGSALQFLTNEKGGSRQVRSGVLSDIRVTPDTHANSLIVTASEKSMDLIAALIQTLDRPSATVGVIKVFTLDNADASQMVVQ